MMDSGAYSLEQFLDVCRLWFPLIEPESTRHAHLFHDWGLDSFDVFRMTILIEDLAGIETDDPAGPLVPIVTVTDAFNYYLELFQWKHQSSS